MEQGKVEQGEVRQGEVGQGSIGCKKLWLGCDGQILALAV